MLSLIESVLSEIYDAWLYELNAVAESLFTAVYEELTNWSNYVVTTTPPWVPILLAVPNAVILTLANVPSRMAAIPARVVLKVASARLPFPNALRHRVMTLQDAARLVAWSLVDLPLQTILTPIPAEWSVASWVMGKWRFWNWLTAIAPRVNAWTTMISALKRLVERMISATITLAGSIVLLTALYEFGKRLDDPVKRDEMFKAALSQDSPIVKFSGSRRVRRNQRPGPDRSA